MSSSNWERQRAEVESYNTFFSALTPRANDSLLSHGFELPVTFTEIGAERKRTAHPDFVLYDGSSCILVEVKQGSNFEPRHIEQMTACGGITISEMEEFLKRADVREKTSYDGNISSLETSIVYQGIDEDYVQKCLNKWDECEKQLTELSLRAVVMAQEKGGFLRIVSGEFEEPRLNSIFDPGILLPSNPSKEFKLTEGREKESLAVAICLHWGQKAATGPTRITASDVRNHFSPRHALNVGKVERVLEYLVKIKACTELGDEFEKDYEFTVEHMDSILTISELVSVKGVEEYLKQDDQTDLDEFW